MKGTFTFICHDCPKGRKVDSGPDLLYFETEQSREETVKTHDGFYPDHKTELGRATR